VTPLAPGSFDALLKRMHERDGVGTLAGHLEARCGIPVAKMSQLDVGVFRVDRADRGVPLVARLFSKARPYSAAEADVAVLRHLAEVDFLAERPYGDQPLSTHEGQSLLLTGFVKQAPKAKRPPHPIVRLGATVARLHVMAVPEDADRPAGALHHFIEGTLTDELRAAAGWLDSIEDRRPTGSGEAFDVLRQALDGADGGDGLPEAFVHPDPVLKNVVFSTEGPVLIDWTSAGRGPRLASMTLILTSGWAAAPFLRGYSKVVTLTDEEWDRLGGLLFSRQLIRLAFRFCRDPGGSAVSAKKLSALRRDCEAKVEALRRDCEAKVEVLRHM
jgi:Ser/Thr protein kinase RdoA (MazF antagonist)